MVSNAKPGRCDGDYYCDAAASCGVSCAEITLFEANRHAFHSVLHGQWDGNGVGAGVGGDYWGLPRDGSYAGLFAHPAASPC